MDGAFLWNCLIFSIKDSEIVLAAKVVLVGNAETGAFTIFVGPDSTTANAVCLTLFQEKDDMSHAMFQRERPHPSKF